MKILNLFAGIGGNRTLWGDDHEITSVEINQQIACIYHKRFPKDAIIVGDAYEYLLWNYDKFEFIWASPPCQTHTQANNFLHAQGIRRYPDMKLWKIIIFLEKFSSYNKNKILWIVENPKPYYKPLRKPSFILGRHYFWSNLNIPTQKYKMNSISIINTRASTRRDNETYLRELCEHIKVDPQLLKEIKAIKWANHDPMGQVLRNAVKPETGKYILDSINLRKQKSIENY